MRKKATINVSGLSIKDILNMDYDDIRKLSESDLSRITSRLVSSANKRIKRLSQSDIGLESPAIESFRQRMGGAEKFSVKVSGDKGERQGKLQHIFTEAKHFLNLKTSTVGGYKKVIKNAKKRFEEQTGQRATDYDIAKLYNTLHKGQEMGVFDGRGTQGSKQAVNSIIDIMINHPELDVYSTIEWANMKMTGQYEESEESEEDYDDFDFIEDYEDM